MTQDDISFSIEKVMRPVVNIQENDTLYTCISRMIGERRNSLVVINEEGVTTGTVNALDIISAILPEYLEDDLVAARFADQALFKESVEQAKDKQIKEFMSSDFPKIQVNGSALEAASMAVRFGQGRIVVVDESDKPVGVITRTELKQLIGAFLGIEDTPTQ